MPTFTYIDRQTEHRCTGYCRKLEKFLVLQFHLHGGMRLEATGLGHIGVSYRVLFKVSQLFLPSQDFKSPELLGV